MDEIDKEALTRALELTKAEPERDQGGSTGLPSHTGVDRVKGATEADQAILVTYGKNSCNRLENCSHDWEKLLRTRMVWGFGLVRAALVHF